MSEAVTIPETLKNRVVGIGGEVRPEDVDVYRRLREIEDKSYKLRTVLEARERQQSEERALRQGYAKKLLIALFAQMGLVNIAFFLIGFRWLAVEVWVANTFIMAVFGEIAAMALIMIKYLFPEVGSDVLGLIEKLWRSARMARIDLRDSLNAISDVVNNRPRALREFGQIFGSSAPQCTRYGPPDAAPTGAINVRPPLILLHHGPLHHARGVPRGGRALLAVSDPHPAIVVDSEKMVLPRPISSAKPACNPGQSPVVDLIDSNWTTTLDQPQAQPPCAWRHMVSRLVPLGG